MSYFKKLFSAHRWLALLLAAEIAVLAFGLLGGRNSAVPIQLTGGELAAYYENTVADAEGCRLPENTTENIAFATTNWMSLPKGSYQAVVTYEAEGFGGQCYFINDVITANTIRLAPNSQSAVFSVWVTDELENAQIHFDVLGTDADGNTQPSNLNILSVSLTPTGRAGRVNFAVSLAIFVLLDLIVLLAIGGWNPLPTLKGRYIALALGAIALFASLPLFTDYLSWGHDLCYHLTRIQGIADGLMAGQFPVRVAPTLLHGAGYCGDVFYCDLFLYPAAFLRIWGFSLQACYKCYLVAVNLATAIISWWCLRGMLRNEKLAVLGSALYTFSLYRLTNLYTRGAVGEYTAMAFFPLIVYGLWRLLSPVGEELKTPEYRRAWLPLAVGFGGIVCSHVLSCEMAALFTALCCLVFVRRVFRKETFLGFCKAVGAVVLSCLWFLVPFADFFLRDSFSVNSIQDVVPYNLTKTAVYVTQIFGAFVNPDGYSNPVSMGMAGEMPLSMGFVPAVAALLFLLCLLDPACKKCREFQVASALCGFGLLAALLTTDLFPWYALADTFPPVLTLLTALQYLWRFLAPATLLLTFAGCLSVGILEKGRAGQRTLSAAGAAAMLIFTFVSAGWLYYSVMNTALPTHYYDLQDMDSATSQIGSGEYLPAQSWESHVWNSYGSSADDGIVLEQTVRTAKDFSAVCQNTADSEKSVRTPLLAYRYYHAVDDTTGDELTLGTNEEGFLTVTLPAGFSGSFTVVWRAPLLWRTAEAISLFSVLGFAALTFWQRKKKAEKEHFTSAVFQK